MEGRVTGGEEQGSGEDANGGPELRGASTAPEDMTSMLSLLAETIVDAMGFGASAINIVRDDGCLEVVAVAGDAAAQAALLGMVNRPEIWDELLDLSEPCGRLRFLDHGRVPARVHPYSWIPDVEPTDVPDAWHPEDALFAPLVSCTGRRLGILSVDLPADGRRPGSGTCRALEAFAIAAALAIEHSALRADAEASRRRYRHLALRDRLTGAANRQVFFDRLEALSTDPHGEGEVWVLFIDIDRFKDVNDRYSHIAGDHVLQTVVRRVMGCVRGGDDSVVRWGGDEFVIVLEGLTGAEATKVEQRIVDCIAEPIDYQGERLSVTASVGAAGAPLTPQLDADDLVRRADAAMYRMKRAHQT